MKIVQLLFFFLLVLTGCSEKQNSFQKLENLQEFDLKKAKPIKLIEDHNFETASQPQVTKIGDVAVDSKDNVYLVNVYKTKIEAFNEQGAHIGSIGRAGNDPGEFQQPGNIEVLGDRLYAFDENLNRVHFYSLDDFNVLNSTDLNIAASLGVDSLKSALPYAVQVMTDGTFLVSYQVTKAPDNRRLFYYRVSPEAEVISGQLMTFKNKSLYPDDTKTKPVIMMLPYERQTLVTTDSQKNIYSINTNRFLIRVSDSSGTYLKAYYYPFKNKTLKKSDVLNLYTNVYERRAIRGAALPKTWPAVAQIIVDEKDRLWVAAISENLENYRWYVMGSDGTVMGTFTLSRDFEVKAVKNDYLFVKQYNRQQYSDEILRYKVEF